MEKRYDNTAYTKNGAEKTSNKNLFNDCLKEKVYKENFWVNTLARQSIINKHIIKTHNESIMRTIKSNPTARALNPTPKKGLRN
jgi:hypothetical protein|tara:strand:+ start:404 stop:655 length:252 start_codon:yes stop_codon:yes gene_type:complete